MNLVTWKPFSGFMPMHRRFNRLMDAGHHGCQGYHGHHGHDDTQGDVEAETENQPSWVPATNIFETADEYVFKMSLPGLTKDDINVEFHDNTLTIKGERKADDEVKDEDYLRVESCSGTFSRSFSLPRDADAHKMNALMKNGILELRVAKAEEKKPREIPINFN